MTSERDKILAMVSEGKVSADEGNALLAALEKPNGGRWRLLFNPFERLPEAAALGGATAVAIAGALVAITLGVRFDGALDVHVSGGGVVWWLAIVDQIVGWPLVALALWGGARLIGRKGRFVDFLIAVGIARIGLVVMGLVAALLMPQPEEMLELVLQQPYHPAVLGLAVVTVALLSWTFALLFNGFRLGSGMVGARLVMTFVVALLAAELVSKILLVGIGGNTFASAPTVAAAPYELTGDTVEARAEAFVDLLEQGRFDDAWRSFGPKMADAMSPTGLAWTWRLTKLKTGDLERIERSQVNRRGDMQAVDLLCAFANERTVVRVVVGDDGRVRGLWFLDPEKVMPDAEG